LQPTSRNPAAYGQHDDYIPPHEEKAVLQKELADPNSTISAFRAQKPATMVRDCFSTPGLALPKAFIYGSIKKINSWIIALFRSRTIMGITNSTFSFAAQLVWPQRKEGI